MTRLRRVLRDDEGSTLLLTIGMAMLALTLILTVTAATSLAVERRQLFTVGDGAALVASETFLVDDLVGISAPTQQLQQEALIAAARDWVAQQDPSGETTVVDAYSADGHSATVVVSKRWRPAWLGWLLPEGLVIQVTVTARTMFGQ